VEKLKLQLATKSLCDGTSAMQQACSGNRRSGCSKHVQETDAVAAAKLFRKQTQWLQQTCVRNRRSAGSRKQTQWLATKRGAVNMGSPNEEGRSIKSDCTLSKT